MIRWDWEEDEKGYVLHQEREPVEHYSVLSPEPIDVINSWNLNFNLGNVVKYVARHDKKGTPIADLQKARDYIDHEINRIRRTQQGTGQEPAPV